MLEELHEMTARIEKLSRAEHDLISDVHPQVAKSRRTSKPVEKLFRPKGVEHVDFSIGRAGFVIGYRTAARRRLDGRVFA